MRGADYCYFYYPWNDQYEDLYDCLESEGIDKEYLSSICEQEYLYNLRRAEKTGQTWNV